MSERTDDAGRMVAQLEEIERLLDRVTALLDGTNRMLDRILATLEGLRDQQERTGS